MKKLTKKILVSIALVLCLGQTVYADEEVELSDGPVQEIVVSSAEELEQMQNGSQIPVYITEGGTSAPETDEVIMLVNTSVQETNAADTTKSNIITATATGTSLGTKGPGGNGTSNTLVSAIGPGQSSGTASKGNGVVQTSAKRMELISYAKQFLGNPYVFGGTSLTNGADCSGFVQQIFKKFDITTGRSSRDQYAKSQRITKEELKPGDLIFYASGDYINHVAIYCGNDVIVHAANASTGIVTGNAWYREPYGYGRFIQD